MQVGYAAGKATTARLSRLDQSGRSAAGQIPPLAERPFQGSSARKHGSPCRFGNSLLLRRSPKRISLRLHVSPDEMTYPTSCTWPPGL